ncbi:MAG: xanthine dehydrogenase subunit D [Actinobacteria bacterium]|nr:xanthine dehydrogenase subunit D [Actinomycetota bacterium]
MTTTATWQYTRAGVGSSALRPDGVAKVQGRFAFSSDLWADGMLWGQVVRSPHPSALIRSIDTSKAWSIPGVRAVLTAADVPGSKTYGLEQSDQPVFASHVVRYVGEPVAAIGADHPEIARRAARAIQIGYEELEPLVDPEVAITASPIHPDGNIFRHIEILHGNPDVSADVSVEGTYEVGMQDQAFMGPESGLAIPAEDGGVDLYISTQWLHVDRHQVARCLGLPEEKVRLHLAGVGGAFGAREDVSIQVHICLLALATKRPVKMVLSREESFYSHVHRHPARIWMRHKASSDGYLACVEARIILDGGAYASSSTAVISNAASFATGPYRVPNALVRGWAVRTNNPPCGAMRGFGAVQACFAYEAQMDKLASTLGMDPVQLRVKNALRRGDRLITGQLITGTAPVAEVIQACAESPLPPGSPSGASDMELPGAAGRTADRSRIVRGVGFALGYKNLMYSEGFDDYATARCRLERSVATITSAAAEVGQGFVTLAQQIAREELGVKTVLLAPASTVDIGSAGSTSASRQSWMSGGAVQAACRAVAAKVIERAALLSGVPATELRIEDGRVRSLGREVDEPIEAVIGDEVIEETAMFRHAKTMPLGQDGQGDAHVAFVFASHRAVVDVDLDLGLVKVVEISTAQDVGKVLNPLQVKGQIEGGIAQGVGLAVMEEIVLDRGRLANPSFTDYLIPTAMDMPVVNVAALIEQPEPGAPFGAKGVGEPPTISSTAAVVAAIRAATGLELSRVPVRPQDIALACPDGEGEGSGGR